MLNIVIELEKGNLNPLIEAFGYNRQYCIVRKEGETKEREQLLKELLEMNRGGRQRVKMAAAHRGRVSMFYMEDIYYIEAFRNRQRIKGKSGSFEFYGTLYKIERIVEPMGFLRIHQSFVISLRHVTSATSRSVTMVNGKEILVGRKYLPKYREARKYLQIHLLH